VALVSGWGRGTWSEGAWSTPLPIEVTGVSASGQVGAVTVTADANVPETGLQAVGSIGGVQVNTDQVLAVTGETAGPVYWHFIFWLCVSHRFPAHTSNTGNPTHRKRVRIHCQRVFPRQHFSTIVCSVENRI
jgi:hypothetical protein